MGAAEKDLAIRRADNGLHSLHLAPALYCCGAKTDGNVREAEEHTTLFDGEKERERDRERELGLENFNTHG